MSDNTKNLDRREDRYIQYMQIKTKIKTLLMNILIQSWVYTANRNMQRNKNSFQTIVTLRSQGCPENIV